jgi:hypothetical protein
MKTIDQLAAEWRAAKDKEEAGKAERIAIELELLKLHPAKEEGSETFTTDGGVKVKLTGKLSYKADMTKLEMLTATWNHDARPFKTEVKLDETKLKMIRANAPRLWAEIAPAIEVKPAKTGVEIAFKE